MIKFEIDATKKQLSFECAGEPDEITVDALVCLRMAYDSIKKSSEEMADRMIGFIVTQLINPEKGFYDEVDWDDQEWEEPKC